VDAEWSRRRDGTSATRVKADDRYGGARPFKALYVSTATLYSTDGHAYTALLRPRRTGVHATYCDERVCMSVRSNTSKSTRSYFMKLSVHVNCGRCSVVLWPQCNILCISGFVDDAMFTRNGPCGAWLIGRMLKVIHQDAALGQSVILRFPCSTLSTASTGAHRNFSREG